MHIDELMDHRQHHENKACQGYLNSRLKHWIHVRSGIQSIPAVSP